MTTMHDVALLRLVAQRIAGPGSSSVSDAVRWLTAVQAQDPRGVLTSIALRATAGSRQAVETALNAGEIVKSWPMRGTLHIVAAEDLPWMLQVTATRAVAGAAGRRTQLELDAATLERARELAVTTLTGGNQLSREELFTTWNDGGLATGGQRGYHMLGYLAQTGTLCFARIDKGKQLVALIDEWVKHSRRLERDEALGELTLRYFRSRGPATVKDFARWANLTTADVRIGIGQARPKLARVEVEHTEYFLDPHTTDVLDRCRRQARGVFLLPGFDEFIVGYADRHAALPAAYAGRVAPGGGLFRPTVVSDGLVVGTWKHTGRRGQPAVSATPFVSFADSVAAAIPEVYATLP